MVSVLSTVAKWRDVPQRIDGHIAELVLLKCRSREGAWRPQGRRPVRHGPLRPAGGGSGAKATEGRIKGLLLDTAKLAAAATLSMM
jgi:hypothetical protein